MWLIYHVPVAYALCTLSLPLRMLDVTLLLIASGTLAG
eukprot:gene1615-1643_t